MHHAQLTESLTTGSNAATWLAQLEASGMSHEQALVLINQNISQQALIIGSNDVFYVFGWVFLLLIGLIWLAKPPFHH
jgi:DHA2 family multidrug resistance protein